MPEPATPPLNRPTLGDLWGGLAAMLVALPSSIAFGVLVFTAGGAQYAGAGALAGALGAAALGLTTPLLSRNGGFITAPCAPAAAVMGGLALELSATRGLPVGKVFGLMVLAALLSAVLQVVYGVLGFGRAIKYIPYQVVTGYLSGVALIIALGQLPKLLGLSGEQSLLRALSNPADWRWEAIVVGVVTIVATGLAPRVTKRLPATILGLVAGVVAHLALGLLRPELLASSNNPLVIGALPSARDLGRVVSENIASLADLQASDVWLVLAGAGTLSVLLSIDTLKTGIVLDTMTHGRHDANRELVAQGIGNGVTALVGGMPGAATMGPTLVNFTSGGRSPWSGWIEGVLVATVFLTLSRVIAWVPLAALAGILLVVAYRMVDWKSLYLALQPETRLDFVIIAIVVVVAEGVGLIQATITGVGLAMLLFIRDQARGSALLRKRDLTQTHSQTSRPTQARELLDQVGDQAMLAEVGGNLFFGTTDGLFEDLSDDLDTLRFLLLDLRRVHSIDYTAGQLLQQMQQRLSGRGGALLLCGMPSRLSTGVDIPKYLERLGVSLGDDGVRLFELRDQAIDWMEEQLLAAEGWTGSDTERALDLSDFEVLAGLSPEELECLRAIARPVRLEEGATLFEKGDQGDAVYLVRCGALRILLPLKGSTQRHQVASLGRGHFVGELSFLDSRKRSATAVAAERTELFALSRADLDAAAAERPGLGQRLFESLAIAVSERLRSANKELRTLEQR